MATEETHSKRIFHIFEPGAWQQFHGSDLATWEPASLAREGFVHLSFESQILGTLRAHYRRFDQVWIVEVEISETSESGLVLEPSRDGERFPHLYRALRRSEMVAFAAVTRNGPEWNAEAIIADNPAGATASDLRLQL